MAKKLSNEEVTHFINVVLGGDAYIKQESKGDAVKEEALRAEIEATRTTKVTFGEAAGLLTSVVDNYIVPHFTMVDEETLMLEMLLKDKVPTIKKLKSALEIMHKNGDISDASYKEITSKNYGVVSKDFKDAAKHVKQVHEDVKNKLSKVADTKKKIEQTHTDKDVVAKATFDGNKSIKLNAYRKK